MILSPRNVALYLCLPLVLFLCAFSSRIQTHTKSGYIFSFINFGKVGSSSMRAALFMRAQQHNWQNWSTVVIFRGVLGNFAWDTLICDPRSGHDCLQVPDGYVVQSNYGFCDQIRDGRMCRYFTIIREPVQRAISAWNYFCLQCHESGWVCHRSQCPRVNLTNFPYLALDQRWSTLLW